MSGGCSRRHMQASLVCFELELMRKRIPRTCETLGRLSLATSCALRLLFLNRRGTGTAMLYLPTLRCRCMSSVSDRSSTLSVLTIRGCRARYVRRSTRSGTPIPLGPGP